MQRKSSRDKQKVMFIILIICFVIFFLFSVFLGKQKQSNIKKLQNNNASISETENIDSEIRGTPVVTGKYGENDTLVPATFNKIINEKVIEVNVNNETIQVAMIGIDVKSEKKDEELEFLNEILNPKQKIWLQYDENTFNDEGQDQCYIWLSDEVGLYNYISCKNFMLQGLLLSKGLVEPINEYPNSRYEANFKTINDNKEEQ